MNLYIATKHRSRSAWVARYATVAMAVLALGGCATINDLLQTNPDPLFTAPNTALVLPSTVNGLGAPTTDCESKWLAAQTTAIPSDVDRFTAAMSCSLRGGPAQHARFVEVGRLLATRQCDVFLDSLEDKRVHTGYNQTNMNTLVAGAAAVLAKTGHHAQSIFNLATGAVAANALIDNYRANYVMTHSLYQLRKKIKEGQLLLDTAIDAAIAHQSFTSFDDAKQDLLDYGEWCSHKTLVDIINSALRDTKISAETPEQSLASKDKQALFEQAKLVDAKIKGKAFTDRQFSLLFALAKMGSRVRVASISTLNREDTQTKKSRWVDPLNDADLALIVKALKLDVDADAGNDVAKKIVNIGLVIGYQFGLGNAQEHELNLALGGSPISGSVAKSTTTIQKKMGIGQLRSNFQFTQK